MINRFGSTKKNINVITHATFSISCMFLNPLDFSHRYICQSVKITFLHKLSTQAVLKGWVIGLKCNRSVFSSPIFCCCHLTHLQPPVSFHFCSPHPCPPPFPSLLSMSPVQPYSNCWSVKMRASRTQRGQGRASHEQTHGAKLKH